MKHSDYQKDKEDPNQPAPEPPKGPPIRPRDDEGGGEGQPPGTPVGPGDPVGGGGGGG